jgi:acylphosphatase
MIAKRCLIAGRVQGVFYRATAQQHARELGIKGFARNLHDGNVEVLAIGEAARIDELVRRLWRGSPASQVISIETIDVPLSELGELPQHFLTA